MSHILLVPTSFAEAPGAWLTQLSPRGAAEQDCWLRTVGNEATRLLPDPSSRKRRTLSARTLGTMGGDAGVDSSFQRRQPAFYPIGVVIRGILQIPQGVSAASLPCAVCKQTCTPTHGVKHRNPGLQGINYSFRFG
jgi:hypothetical protein